MRVAATAAAAAAAALFACVGAARAETGVPFDSGCEPVEVIVPAALPGNVTGIPVLGSTTRVTASLLAADGTVVPTELIADNAAARAQSILVPLAPLTTLATYTVRWSDDCVGYRTKTFKATEPIPLPSEAGSTLLGAYEDSFDGICDGAGRPRMRRSRALFLTASDDIVPWLAISDVDVLVDGEVHVSRTYDAWGLPRDGRGDGYADHACPTAPTTHRAALRVRVPNGPTLIARDTAMTYDCPDDPPRECRVFLGDDGHWLRDPDAPNPSRGCASTRTSHGDAASIAAVIALLAVIRGSAPRSPRVSTSSSSPRRGGTRPRCSGRR